MNVRRHWVQVFQLRISTSGIEVRFKKKVKLSVSQLIGLHLIQTVMNDEGGKSCVNQGRKEKKDPTERNIR